MVASARLPLVFTMPAPLHCVRSSPSALTSPSMVSPLCEVRMVVLALSTLRVSTLPLSLPCAAEIPGSRNEFMALKVKELEGTTHTVRPGV